MKKYLTKLSIRRQLLLVLIYFSLTSLKCKKDNPTQPPPSPTNCEYAAGNRNFTWRMDTVAWFPSTVAGVWAFSDTDAYVLGTIVDGKPPYTNRIGRHWNGRVWEDNINGTWGYDNITGKWGDISIGPRNDIIGDNNFMVTVGYWGIDQMKYAGIAEFNNQTKKWKSYQLQTVGELRSLWTDGNGYFIAVGDNGMVYTKDGYTSEWVYTKAPTEFGFYDIVGVSKNEIYMSAYQSLASGEFYTQGWKLEQGLWKKLFDTKDTTDTPLHLTLSDYPNEMGVWRCNITDSIKLYVIGDQSYLFESKGQLLDFRKTNLSDFGLPLKANGRSGIGIDLFSPKDLWIFGTRYNFYHWNGSNFMRMYVATLPIDDIQFGTQRRMIKTTSGKVFLPTEISSQVYVVVQGLP